MRGYPRLRFYDSARQSLFVSCSIHRVTYEGGFSIRILLNLARRKNSIAARSTNVTLRRSSASVPGLLPFSSNAASTLRTYCPVNWPCRFNLIVWASGCSVIFNITCHNGASLSRHNEHVLCHACRRSFERMVLNAHERGPLSRRAMNVVISRSFVESRRHKLFFHWIRFEYSLEYVLLPTPQKFVMYACGNDEDNKESIRGRSSTDVIAAEHMDDWARPEHWKFRIGRTMNVWADLQTLQGPYRK